MIEAYLMFDGRCDEAIEFYKSAMGAELEMLMRFSESPDPIPEDMLPPGNENKVMHASIKVGGSRIMMSDGNCNENAEGFKGFSLSNTVADANRAKKVFDALCEGGKVVMPLGETFWSPCFGMVEDKFGVGWMVTVPDMKG